MSKITVLIPSLVEVDKKYLKVCVDSLRASVNWDIIVVANGTKDHNPLHDTPIKGITKFYITKQQGQCNAVNRAAEGAEGDTKWLFISNSDMYYTPLWTKNLPDFDDPSTPLCFSPNLVEPTNNPGSAAPFLKYNGGFTLDEFRRPEVNNFLDSQADSQEPEWTDGFNLPFFIRADVWRAIGGYDEKYDPWGSNSDTDLQTKINIAGIIPKRLRKVLVYHFSNKSGTFDRSIVERDQAWWNNFNYYRDKFGYTRDDEPKADVWMNENVVLKDKLIYHPDWENKYAQ